MTGVYSIAIVFPPISILILVTIQIEICSISRQPAARDRSASISLNMAAGANGILFNFLILVAYFGQFSVEIGPFGFDLVDILAEIGHFRVKIGQNWFKLVAICQFWLT